MEQVLLRLRLEWLCAKQNGVKDNAECPGVGLRTKVLVATAELRRHVSRSAAECCQFLVVRPGLSSKPEIDQFRRHHRLSNVDEDVLQLDVSVSNAQILIEGHGAGKLENDLGTVSLREILPHSFERLLLHDLIQHLSMAALDDEVQLPVAVDCIKEPHDIRVPVTIIQLSHCRKQLNLTHDTPLDLSHLLELVLVVNLDGDCVTGLNVQSLPNNRVGTLSQHLSEPVFRQLRIVGRLDEILLIRSRLEL